MKKVPLTKEEAITELEQLKRACERSYEDARIGIEGCNVKALLRFYGDAVEYATKARAYCDVFGTPDVCLHEKWADRFFSEAVRMSNEFYVRCSLKR